MPPPQTSPLPRARGDDYPREVSLWRNPSLLFALGVSAVVAATFTSCVGTPAVATHADPAANFAQYRTFALLPAREPLNPAAKPESLRAADEAATQALAARGLQATDVNAADLLVLVHGGGREIVAPPETGFSYGRFRPWGFGGGAYELSAPRPGMVLIDVFDARRRELVWRGTAEVAEPESLPAAVRTVAVRFPQ
jgi:hypothetical protein